MKKVILTTASFYNENEMFCKTAILFIALVLTAGSVFGWEKIAE